MSILTAQGDALIHAGAYDLEAKLWEMDTRLSLKMRVIEHPKRKGVKGRRYEVWRRNEDGQDSMIGHWRLDEFDRIWPDMQVMRAGAEGRVDDVLTRLDKDNDARDRQATDEFNDAYGRLAEHKLALERDRDGKTRF